MHPENLKVLDGTGLPWFTRLCNVVRKLGKVQVERQTEGTGGEAERRLQLLEPQIQKDQCGFHPGCGAVSPPKDLNQVHKHPLYPLSNGWHHIHTLQVRRVCVSAQSWWDLWGFKGCHGDSWRGARLWKDEEEDEEELLSMLQRSRERGAKLIPDNSTVCATEVSYLRPRTTKAEPELIQEDCCCEGHLSPRDKGEIETILGMIICLVWPETVWYPCTHVTSVKRNKWLQVRCTARRGV